VYVCERERAGETDCVCVREREKKRERERERGGWGGASLLKLQAATQHVSSGPALRCTCHQSSDKCFWAGFRVSKLGFSTRRCRVNVAHIRQSSPDSGSGVQVKGLATLQVVLRRSTCLLAPRSSVPAVSSEYGTYKTVKPAFWPWLSGESEMWRVLLPERAFV
jgi:hypothetical protein